MGHSLKQSFVGYSSLHQTSKDSSSSSSASKRKKSVASSRGVAHFCTGRSPMRPASEITSPAKLSSFSP